MSELTAYRTYMLFNVLKLHFSQERYDIRKYGTTSKRFSYDKFEKDRFGKVYYALAKRLEDERYAATVIAANLVRDTGMQPVSLNEELGKPLYKYIRNKVALLEDIKYHISSTNLLTRVKNDDIIGDMISGNIPIEIISYLSRLIPLKQLIDSTTTNRYMWDIARKKIEKYEPFCLFDSTEQMADLKRSVMLHIQTQRTEVTDI